MGKHDVTEGEFFKSLAQVGLLSPDLELLDRKSGYRHEDRECWRKHLVAIRTAFYVMSLGSSARQLSNFAAFHSIIHNSKRTTSFLIMILRVVTFPVISP